MLTFADAFTGAAALGPPGRARVALVLGWRRAAIERAPLGDIHDRRHRRRLRDAVVGAADDGGVLERMADASLADLAPCTSLLADDEIGAHECHARLFNLLAGQRVTRWSALLGLRLRDVRAWPQASDRSTAEIVGLAFERSLVGLASAHHDTARAGAAVDLAILLDYEQHAPSQPLLDALAALSGEGHPDQVRRAATRLVRTARQAGHHGEVWTDILAAAGDPRDVEVFELRTLRLARRPTIDDVAKRVGLSGERVRQIRLRAEGRVRAAASAAPQDTRALVGAVRGWLGSVVPVDVADDLARRLGVGSAQTRIGGLLLWLAGPYLPVPGRDGWLALDPAGAVARTTEWLAEDGGVRPAQEIRDELAVEGVRPEHHDAWMAACGGVAVDDMVVHVSGGLATVAERTLFATGRGLTPAEIAALVAGPDRVGDLRVVLERDRRFARVSADVYELAEWGRAAAPAPAPHGATAPAGTCIDGRWWLRVPVDADVLRGGNPARLGRVARRRIGHARSPANVRKLLRARDDHRRGTATRAGSAAPRRARVRGATRRRALARLRSWRRRFRSTARRRSASPGGRRACWPGYLAPFAHRSRSLMRSTPAPTTLEEALDAVERDADAALRALSAAAREAKRLKAAAANGQLRDVQQAVDAVDRLAQAAAATATELKSRLAFRRHRLLRVGRLHEGAPGRGGRGRRTRRRVRSAHPLLPEHRPGLTGRRHGGHRQEEGTPSPAVGSGSATSPTSRTDRRSSSRRRSSRPWPPPTTWWRAGPGPPSSWPASTACSPSCRVPAATTPGPSSLATSTSSTRAASPSRRTAGSMSLPASALTRGSGVLTTVTRVGQVKVYAGIAFNDAGSA